MNDYLILSIIALYLDIYMFVFYSIRREVECNPVNLLEFNILNCH